MAFFTKFFFTFPIALSAFLLFLVQPILSKQILPWFGGSASVWNTCLFFFQLVLMAGYIYAYALNRFLSARWQMIVHVLLLTGAALSLPVIASTKWVEASGDPSLTIVLLLFATVGLPYFALSSTSPLLQSWYARTFSAPYRLFALSNAASLVGLLAYPLAVEPFIAVREQAAAWSFGFCCFAITCAIAAFMQTRQDTKPDQPTLRKKDPDERPLLWIGLSALGSLALVSVTSFIAKNIASMPLIWVVPLAIYLSTFIIAFRERPLPMKPIGLGAFILALSMVLGARWTDFVSEFLLSLPIYLGGLFVVCLYCHGELSTTKPAPERLTYFYILVSLGGAIGALCSSIVAPLLFSGDFEMPLTLAAIAGLILWRTPRLEKEQENAWRWTAPALCALVICVSAWNIVSEVTEARILKRNFYSSIRIIDTGTGVDLIRRMEHGGIEHGSQFVDPSKSRIPLAYYGKTSGVALAIESLREARQHPLNIGVIGLGAGTLAAFGEKGGRVRMYEINPQVVDLAYSQFTYLTECQAQVDVRIGDARLVLERESPQNFDVLVVDAFSGDAIPIHLLTKEALDIYRRHLSPGGLLLFNISNRFVNLQAPLARLAAEAGLEARIVSDDNPSENEDTSYADTDWVIMTTDPRIFASQRLAQDAKPLEPAQKGPAWTDDFNTILTSIRLDGSGG